MVIWILFVVLCLFWPVNDCGNVGKSIFSTGSEINCILLETGYVFLGVLMVCPITVKLRIRVKIKVSVTNATIF